MYENVPDLIGAYAGKYRNFRLSLALVMFSILVILPFLQVITIGRPSFNSLCGGYSFIIFLILLLVLLILGLRVRASRFGFWFRREVMEGERWSLYLLLLSILGFVLGMVLTMLYWTLGRPSGLEFSRIWNVLPSYLRLAAIYLGFAVYYYYIDRRSESRLRGARVMTRYIRSTEMDVEDSVAWALNSLKLPFTRTESGGWTYLLTGKKEVMFDVDYEGIRVRIQKLTFGGFEIMTYTPVFSEISKVMEVEKILESAMRGWQV